MKYYERPWNMPKTKGKKKNIEGVAEKVGDTLYVDYSTEGKPIARYILKPNDFKMYYPAGNALEENERLTSSFKYPYCFTYKIKDNKNREIVYSDETRSLIAEYTKRNVEKDVSYALQSHASDIAHRKSNKAWERIWDKRKKQEEEMKSNIPSIPKAFINWAKKDIAVHKMVFNPFMKEKETKAICTNCLGVSTFEKSNMEPAKSVKCPFCKQKAIAIRHKWDKDNLHFVVEDKKDEYILLQPYMDGLVERYFVFQFIASPAGETIVYAEKERYFKASCEYNKFMNLNYKSNLDSYNYENWSLTKDYYGGFIDSYGGKLYTKNLDFLKETEYKYCGIEFNKVLPITAMKYLSMYKSQPMIEMFSKMGLPLLLLDMNNVIINSEAKKPLDKLGISKVAFKKLIKFNGDSTALKWLRYDDSVKESELKFFVERMICPNDVSFITDRMSIVQIANYLKKQLANVSNNQARWVIGKWRDYIDMARIMRMNVNSELIYKPKNFVKAHDELAESSNDVRRQYEIEDKFPNVNSILSEIKTKYEYADKEFSIVVPENVNDIIKEGQALRHCLDKSDIYFDRISRKESFILFLRRTEDVETPFYTLEVEPNGTARQKRTLGDKQDKDFQDCVNFIKKWQRAIKKRLTDEDEMLQLESKIARESNFAQLLETKTQIWHGPLAGQLLGEVLMADLMEA